MPCAYLTVEEPGTGRRRRAELCPEEWGDGFGEEFYAHAMENDFYYLTNSYNWNASAASRTVPGLNTIKVLSPQELLDRKTALRERLVVANG